MPQLDLGVLFSEFFLNSFFFWFIYLYNILLILPKINKILKLRMYKLKKISFDIVYYTENFIFFNKNIKKKHESIDLFFNVLQKNLKNQLVLLNINNILFNYMIYKKKIKKGEKWKIFMFY